MLVLSRHKDEEIVIGAGTPGEIRIAVLGISGDKVRLGIAAPNEVTVHRKEVQDEIDLASKGGEPCKS
jgi:carbon storage regulator